MLAHDMIEAEIQARIAIDLFGEFESDQPPLQPARPLALEDIDLENVANQQSASFGILGDALLAQQRIAEARIAYMKALDLLSAREAAVNEGQLLHQIGNCESRLGHDLDAAQYYLKAAVRFQAIGMREYLSNALGELGHTVLDLGSVPSFLTDLPIALIGEGLDDAGEHLAHSYGLGMLDPEACAGGIRKLFGVVVLGSLSDLARKLGGFAHVLGELVIDPAEARLASDDPDELASMAVDHLAMLANLIDAIAVFEQSALKAGRIGDEDIEQLAKCCFLQGAWAGLQDRSFQWLALYLSQKWSIKELTAESLQAACIRLAKGERFRLLRQDTQR